MFETLRTYAGVPFELAEHLARLSAERRSWCSFHFRSRYPLSRVEILQAVAAAGNPESYVRLMITRGQGALGLNPALAEHPVACSSCSRSVDPPSHYYTDGVATISYRTQRQVDATSAEGAKIGNYLVSVLAMREASAVGAVEALIIDAQGRVLEGGSSNVFLVKDNELITPGTDAGILAGITRAHVLELAQALGIDVQLRAPKLDEAYAADEVFITSSIRELVPVVKLDRSKIGSGKPGPVFQQLSRAFRERVKATHGHPSSDAPRPVRVRGERLQRVRRPRRPTALAASTGAAGAGRSSVAESALVSSGGLLLGRTRDRDAELTPLLRGEQGEGLVEITREELHVARGIGDQPRTLNDVNDGRYLQSRVLSEP